MKKPSLKIRIAGWAIHKLRPVLNKAASVVLNADSRNIERELQRRALADTASFVETHMARVRSFPDARSLLNRGFELMDEDDKKLVLEFGVWYGRSINFMASKISGTIDGFDSFDGLPEYWRNYFDKGAFSLDNLPEVAPNVNLHKGWFNETLPEFLKSHSQEVRFLHVDCDLYSSTKTVFDLLGDRISNTVIIFDEFFNYSGWRNGEFQAFTEFLESRSLKFEYFGYCRYGEQVGVRILGSTEIRDE